MPIYEYECDECGKTVEAIQRLDDPPLTVCTECGGALRKKLSAPAFQFKGSGWYVTDYANRGRAPKEETKESSAKETKGDGGSKTDSAKSAKSGGTAGGGSSSAE